MQHLNQTFKDFLCLSKHQVIHLKYIYNFCKLYPHKAIFKKISVTPNSYSGLKTTGYKLEKRKATQRIKLSEHGDPE